MKERFDMELVTGFKSLDETIGGLQYGSLGILPENNVVKGNFCAF